MDLPIDVQHRILEKLPLKTLFQIRSLHSTFDNYFRFHCKKWRCSSLAIYRLIEQDSTLFQLDDWAIGQKHFEMCRLLTVHLMTISGPGITWMELPIDLGKFGALAQAGGVRARIMQITAANIDEKSREMIRNVHPKVLHINKVFISEETWLSIPPSCEKVVIGTYYNPYIDLTEATGLKEISINQKKAEKLTSETVTAIFDKIREGVATRQMVDGMIEELNSGEPGRLWHYRETDDRHYLCHTHVSFFITKLPTASQ